MESACPLGLHSVQIQFRLRECARNQGQATLMSRLLTAAGHEEGEHHGTAEHQYGSQGDGIDLCAVGIGQLDQDRLR
jgi:hypothetical protein